MPVCNSCGEEKPRSAFDPQRRAGRRHFGITARCSKCSQEILAERLRRIREQRQNAPPPPAPPRDRLIRSEN